MAQSYENAGVNLEAGYEVVRRIKQHVASTARPGSMGGIGSFGGMFDLASLGIKEPVLVSGTDGVGTKLKIAFAMDKHDTIGIDAVAMCVNDVLAQGAEPLFFLDYVALGHNVPAKVEAIVAGVAEGCRQAGCALVGGETAEMPGMYEGDEYDIAGFTTGVVEKSKLIDGTKVKVGDVLVGIASSGVHSNGFSLVRKIVSDGSHHYSETVPEFGGRTLGEVLLTPTRIYVKQVLDVIRNFMNLKTKLTVLRATCKPIRNGRRLVVMLAMLLSTVSRAQDFSGILGEVKDVNGDPIIGATIVEKGNQQNATITNMDGQFALKVSEGTPLVVSYIGYSSKEVTASNRMTVTLEEDNQVLSDVVVIGYGVQKKSVVTASIAKVGSEVLEQTAPVRMDNALRGLASGVQVIAGDGQPGSGTRVRIRGIGTINNSDPLYIVDGMPIGGGIDNINPADIESIEVLKDAASGAVYGARAANGVVLVTTRRGKLGKPQVDYNFSYGWQSPWRKRDMLGAADYKTLMAEAAAYAGEEAPAFGSADTNWQDELFNSGAPVQNHQLSLSGATDRVNYYFSMGYYNQEGIIGGNYGKSNYKRWTFRSNTEYTVFDESKTRNWLRSLKLTVNATYSRIHSIGVTAGSLTGSVLADALFMDPTMSVFANDESELQPYDRSLYGEPVYDQRSGRLLAMPSTSFNELANPLGRLSASPGTKNNSDKLVANLALDFNVWDNLHYRFSWGSDLAFWGSDGWGHPFYLNANNHSDQSSVWSDMNRGYTWQIENVLTYDKNFGDHSFNIVLGQSAERYTARNVGGTRWDLPEYLDDKANINFAIGQQTDGRMSVYGGAGDPNSLSSYFGRLSYNYAERYMLQATVRRDGSSRFGPNNKWGTFPSVSLGWNLTNEPFMQKRPDWLTNLKIRASWGKNGNENIGNFRYTVNVATGNNYAFGEGGPGNQEKVYMGSKPTGTPNADLKWEESEQTDLGIDFGFLNNSLTLTVDYFIKKTNGMLKTMAIPSYLGESLPWGNVGDMKNSGIEIELGYRLHRKDFNFGASLNLSYLKNELTNLGNADGFESMANVHQVGNVGRAENGQPYPFFYGYSTDGIIQNQGEADAYNSKYGKNAVPGDVRFVDHNNDGEINDADKHNIGNGYPTWTFGLNLTAAYRDFDFSMLFSGALGGKIADVTRRLDCRYVNLPAEFMDRWHGEGTSSTMPRFTYPNNDPNNNWTNFSDLYIHNGDYARIKNIQLGYTLPRRLTTRFFVSRLRLYVAAENLLTLTGYKGLDPELANDALPGIDRGYYPQARTYTVGFNLNF